METIELYKIVYWVVKKAQKIQKRQFINNPEMYAWSLLIPEPQHTKDKMAFALCKSVSQSSNIGLELYFGEEVYHEDLVNAKINASNLLDIEPQLVHKNKDGKNFAQLGGIIRFYLKDYNGLTKEHQILLESIK